MTTENKPTKGAFSLIFFKIPKLEFVEPQNENSELNLVFHPSGEFISKKSQFKLTLEFRAYENDLVEKDDKIRILVVLEAVFGFSTELSKEEIPDYFYRNSIAIIFPYIRAFISNLTLQSNITPPIILPTYNLTPLGDTLKQSTTYA